MSGRAKAKPKTASLGRTRASTQRATSSKKKPTKKSGSKAAPRSRAASKAKPRKRQASKTPSRSRSRSKSKSKAPSSGKSTSKATSRAKSTSKAAPRAKSTSKAAPRAKSRSKAAPRAKSRSKAAPSGKSEAKAATEGTSRSKAKSNKSNRSRTSRSGSSRSNNESRSRSSSRVASSSRIGAEGTSNSGSRSSRVSSRGDSGSRVASRGDSGSRVASKSSTSSSRAEPHTSNDSGAPPKTTRKRKGELDQLLEDAANHLPELDSKRKPPAKRGRPIKSTRKSSNSSPSPSNDPTPTRNVPEAKASGRTPNSSISPSNDSPAGNVPKTTSNGRASSSTPSPPGIRSTSGGLGASSRSRSVRSPVQVTSLQLPVQLISGADPAARPVPSISGTDPGARPVPSTSGAGPGVGDRPRNRSHLSDTSDTDVSSMDVVEPISISVTQHIRDLLPSTRPANKSTNYITKSQTSQPESNNLASRPETSHSVSPTESGSPAQLEIDRSDREAKASGDEMDHGLAVRNSEQVRRERSPARTMGADTSTEYSSHTSRPQLRTGGRELSPGRNVTSARERNPSGGRRRNDTTSIPRRADFCLNNAEDRNLLEVEAACSDNDFDTGGGILSSQLEAVAMQDIEENPLSRITASIPTSPLLRQAYERGIMGVIRALKQAYGSSKEEARAWVTNMCQALRDNGVNIGSLWEDLQDSDDCTEGLDKILDQNDEAIARCVEVLMPSRSCVALRLLQFLKEEIKKEIN